MRVLAGNQILREALAQEMERDQRVWLLGEDIGVLGGIYKVTEGLLQRFGRDRVTDMPISESGFVGMAAGAAMLGLRPVVELMFADLFPVCMDQIVNTAAKTRFVTNGLLHVPMVIRTPTISNVTAYQSQTFEAWLAHVPGLKVVMPSKPQDLGGLLLASIRDPDPVIFLENRFVYDMMGEVPDVIEPIPLGQARICREGTDVTLVAWGANMVQMAEQVADQAAEDGVSVEVIDPRTLVPFDLRAIVQSVCKTGRLVVLHEAVRRCGFGAEIVASIADSEAFSKLRAPMIRVANPGVPVPFSRALHKYALPAAEDLMAAIYRVMKRVMPKAMPKTTVKQQVELVASRPSGYLRR
ncbi:MAG: alpha-ketoacid dehydrogenase subunit beta [Pirellulales bacterium]|nr:alpha-ketoacid dehydrogenase subunit beta [Pirellulales bacterium]